MLDTKVTPPILVLLFLLFLALYFLIARRDIRRARKKGHQDPDSEQVT